MEVHPPTKPIESVKDFFLHLAMITIGILIALGLEQSVEAWHHHELGVQARENIIQEIRDNKREIEGERNLAAQNKRTMQQTLDTLLLFLAHKKVTTAEMNVNVSGANLSSTSWATAASTGALSYMGYGEAKRFAKAYDIQALLQRTQEDEFRTAAGALTLISVSKGGPGALSDDELRNAEHEVLNCMAGVALWDQIAMQLDAEYDRVLKAH